MNQPIALSFIPAFKIIWEFSKPKLWHSMEIFVSSFENFWPQVEQLHICFKGNWQFLHLLIEHSIVMLDPKMTTLFWTIWVCEIKLNFSTIRVSINLWFFFKSMLLSRLETVQLIQMSPEYPPCYQDLHHSG